jgi:hypothetical protein
MKIYFFSLLSAVFLSGCDQKSQSSGGGTTKSSSGGSVLTAPVDYLRAAGKAQQSAVKTVDTASLNQAIQLFNVEKGRNPKDLNELVQEKFIPQIPAAPYGTKIVYDSAAGKVTVVKE